MTNATSEALQRYFASHTFTELTMTTSAIAIGLLMIVAIERELLRVLAHGERRNLTACSVIIVPMAIVFAIVIVTRFLRLST